MCGTGHGGGGRLASDGASNLWGFGRDERKELPAISALDVDKAVTLIRDKIRARLEGGPSELSRAFKFFDADGSGTISLEEFRKAMAASRLPEKKARRDL